MHVCYFVIIFYVYLCVGAEDELDLMLNGGCGDGVADVGDDCAGDGSSERSNGGKVKKQTKKRLSPNERYLRKLLNVLEEVKAYGAMLNVIGYNSSSFDLGVFSTTWPITLGFTQPKGHVDKRRHEFNVRNVQVETLDREGRKVKRKSKDVLPHQCKKDICHFQRNIIANRRKTWVN